MTIIGIGTDIVDIKRIEEMCLKDEKSFLEKIFNETEVESGKRYRDKKMFYSHLAKRFAAKEAAAKALGTGIGKDLAFKDACIDNLPSGKPILKITGDGAKKLAELIPENMIAKLDVTLSDEYPMAIATVIISAEQG